jgi:hypothetical protein
VICDKLVVEDGHQKSHCVKVDCCLWTTIFKLYVVKCGTYAKKTRLRAQNKLTTLGSIVNKIRGAYMTI